MPLSGDDLSHVPIGRPIRTPGVCAWTTDLSLFLRGLLGELYIAGVGSGAGLSEALWVDGGAVCGGPAWCGRQPDVPDRGPGAVAQRWRAGVPGAGGCAGQAARFPDRAWRDRGGAASAGWGVAGGGGGAGGCCGEQAAGGLCGGGVGVGGRSVGAAGCVVAGVAGLHGAVCDRCAGSVAADAERQARPPRAACAGA